MKKWFYCESVSVTQWLKIRLSIVWIIVITVYQGVCIPVSTDQAAPASHLSCATLQCGPARSNTVMHAVRYWWSLCVSFLSNSPAKQIRPRIRLQGSSSGCGASKMTVEDDRDNSPLEEQIFGVVLLVPLFIVSFWYILICNIWNQFRSHQYTLYSSYTTNSKSLQKLFIHPFNNILLFPNPPTIYCSFPKIFCCFPKPSNNTLLLGFVWCTICNARSHQ
jgi:hypothetical protein